MKILSLFVLTFLFSSCAYIQKNRSKPTVVPKSPVRFYTLSDKTGRYELKREVGLKKTAGKFIVKTQIFPDDDRNKELEKSITISETGKLKGKLPVLRPSRSQFTVWFEGKKYFSEVKIEKESRSAILTMQSPEKKWSGVKKVPFPAGTGVFCFYSQLVECARITGFIRRAVQKKAGQMTFHIIWEAYPYFTEQYNNVPNELISPARLIYDGKNQNGEYRFSLVTGVQTIFYVVDSSYQLSKVFWVSQGLSIVPK